MRKPLPKIKLTDEEKELATFMADNAKIEWFSIAGYWKDQNGNVLHPSRGGNAYDEVWSDECGNGHYVSVQFGVRVLMEGYDIPQNMALLTRRQRKVFDELAKKVGYSI